MKRTYSFLLSALTAVALAASAGIAAGAPAALSAVDWANLQQQVPFITQQAYLKAAVSSVNAYFGWSVAVSADTVVIGTPFGYGDPFWATLDPRLASPFRTGAALVFVRDGTNWSQQAYLKASNAGSNDWFGVSVAISGDTIVVGAENESSSARGINGDQDDDSARQAGAAYVFVRTGTNWTQQAYLKASNTQGASARFEGGLFGHSVAVSGDTVAVGSFWEGSNATGVNGDEDNYGARVSGAVYVFQRTGTNWSQQAYVKASNTGAGDYFGTAVSLSGDTLVVGAPHEDSNAHGVNGDQTDNSAADSGAAYVFTRSGTNWIQEAYLKASNPGGRPPPTFPPPFPPLPITGDEFGYSVSVSGDTVVVGALYEDSNATGINGNQDDNSADGSGAAYVFVRSGTNWSQQAYLKASNAAAAGNFGFAVAAARETVVVGAPAESSTGVNGDQTNNLAYYSGAAYVFVRDGTTWTQQAYLKASNAGWSDRMGLAVAISGDTVVAGAIGEASHATGVNGDQSDDSVRESGAAYVFAGVGIPPDSDGDGVLDADDDCPNTSVGEITDAHGCSIAQLVPCDGKWRNHGEYFLSLLKVTTRFYKAGLITRKEWTLILRDGLKSDCGKRKRK